MTVLYKGYYPTAKVIVSVAANENWFLYCLNSGSYLLLTLKVFLTHPTI
jgi:hypothetical protein